MSDGEAVDLSLRLRAISNNPAANGMIQVTPATMWRILAIVDSAAVAGDHLAAAVQAERAACVMVVATLLVDVQTVEDTPARKAYCAGMRAGITLSAKAIEARGDTSALDAAIKAAKVEGMDDAKTTALVTLSREKGAVPMVEIARIGMAIATAIRAGIEEKKKA